MKKQILIPTDYSSNAFNAIVYAFKLLKDEDCEFHIFHSYFLVRSAKSNLLFPEPEPAEYKAVEEKSEQKMELLKKKVFELGTNPRHSVLFDHKFGPLIDSIKEKVLKENIDLICMGTRGVTDDIEVAYGRNSVNVMESVRTCAVLAIPASVSFSPLNEIVFPADFKSLYKEKEMQILVNIAHIGNAAIRILHIGKEKDLTVKQQDNRVLLEKYFEGLDFSYHWLENVSVLEGLFTFVERRNSEMISFINRKHWFFGSVFTNPLVKNLGIHSKVPLLALHDSRS
ncbi:MAG TPA: universal stress protein [Aequorivita sp.]|nr:universal stress protein [Aequorivita sp.]